ncbi:YfkD family protein [Bacillaceae bacterium IKA-2]|nr:YfkD family protein [Bacillaceae bacterium IKA-2]
MKNIIIIMTVLCLLIAQPFATLANDKKTEEKESGIPNYVLNISKENTYPNPTQDLPQLQPSKMAQELLDSGNVKIENPELIRILNESTIKGNKMAFMLNASIYLGQWPLAYESNETSVNWEYQKVNTNYHDNRGASKPRQIKYTQDQQKKVSGGLTAQIANSEDVQKMMMIKAIENSGLPLAFSTVIGHGTKKEQVYNVPVSQVGYLYSYVPAANEKGKVTYGEVYLVIKGGKKRIEVKNVTQQGIGAWIPVQDHIALKFYSANQPR